MTKLGSIIKAIFAAETSDPRVRAASIALIALIVNIAKGVIVGAV